MGTIPTPGKLCDYNTAEVIREATQSETDASIAQSYHDGGAGVIAVDGRSCYVEGGSATPGDCIACGAKGGLEPGPADRCGDCGADREGEVLCQCGEWSGERCCWSGPLAETVVVNFMPEYLRESHRAAGNHGSWPANGSIRIRVERSCAERMLADDGEWCNMVTR